MVTVGLLVRIKAKTGREEEVETFLKDAVDTVHEEQATLVWFAFRLSPSEFGIFDAFPDDAGREAHLSGQVASALNDRADELLAEPPTIERCDLLAAKLAALALQ